MAQTEAQPLNVDSILQSVPQYKPITVDKDDDLTYDLGYLSAYDYHPIQNLKTQIDSSDFLKELTRDNVQLLFTKIFQLPSKVVPDGVLAELPKAVTVIPRSKPLPEAREPTKWEQFAKIKGIKKKPYRSALVWDDDHQEYRRRHGYKKANNPEDQWAIPVDEKDKSGVDPFTKMKQDKKVRLEKQAKQEKKNKQSQGMQKARMQASSGAKMKDDIARTFALVSRSTASMGRYDRRLPGETEAPRMKGARKNAGVGSSTTTDLKKEKSANLTLLGKMMAKEEKVNKSKAAAQYIANEQQQTGKRKREDLISGKAFKKPQQKKHGTRKGTK